MSRLSIANEVKDGVDLVLNTFKDVLGINATSRDFNDINKKARENELTLYTLASDNVPSTIYGAVSDAISYQVLSSIRHILSNTILTNTSDVTNYISANFTNNSELVNKLKSSVSDISDSLGENISIDISNINFELNEGPKLKMAAKAVGTAAYAAIDNPLVQAGGTKLLKNAVDKHYDNSKRNITLGGERDKSFNDEDKKSLKIPSKLHTIEINYTTASGEVKNITLTLALSVKIMTVDSVKLTEALVSAKERNVFYSYIKWRANSNRFFKDFILNINEINKQVRRDTSKDLADRILGNLLSKSGFTRPKALAENTELKNFIVIITTEEVEKLKLDYRIDLTRGPGLKTIFNNMNILSLVIYDEVRERLIMFQSDKPTEMNVLSLSDLVDSNKMAKMFKLI